MTRIVTVHEAKTNLSKLLVLVQAGEEVVIARGKEPVARLVAIEALTPKRKPGSLKGKIALDDAFFEPLPESELALWEGGEAEG
jgi:antitoxin (DNA-binding transcriptional repressor) of toxin-antitoxin stability system